MTTRVVFDFGNVLFHWQPPRLLQRLLPQHAPDATRAAALAAHFFQGYEGDWAEFDRGTVSVPELVRRIAARTGLAAVDVQRIVDAVPAELTPLPETVALLSALRAAGTPLLFLSNMPAPYAEHLRATHHFMDWFADGVFSSHVNIIKPEPAIFALAAARFGAAPHELLFFDDVPANVAAARAAGWQALHFTDTAAARAALAERGLIGV